MAKRRVVIVGAGGCAREVAWTLRECDGLEFAGFAVSDLASLGPYDSRERVLGDLDWLRSHRDRFDALAMGIGSPAARLRIADELERDFGPERWAQVLHPSARWERESASLAHGVVICANVVGTVNLVLEAHAMVHYSCTLGHESRLGRASVLNPACNVSGGVAIGAAVMVGTGAQILQYLKIGDGATIGAGAVVTRDLLPGETVTGVPARPLRGGA